MRIDILNAISGVDFDEAYLTRVEGEVENVTVAFISIADFLTNKKATGRPKDIGDIQALEKKQKK